jgi:hypothetical protein
MRKAGAICLGLFVPAIALAQEVGRVAAAQGEVTVTRAGQRFAAAVGVSLFLGDVVHTGEDGRAKLLFEDGTVVNVGDDSVLRVSHLLYDPGKRREGVLDLVGGAIRAWVGRERAAGSRFDVRSRAAVAGIRGTEYAFRETAQGAEIVVFTGEVTVRSASPEIPGECTAGAGMMCRVAPKQAPGAPQMAPAELLNAFRDLTRVASRLGRDASGWAARATPSLRTKVAAAASAIRAERLRRSASLDRKKEGDLASLLGIENLLLDPVPGAVGLLLHGRVLPRF